MITTTADDLFRSAMRRVRPAHTVLDVGAGIRPQSLVGCATHVCIEPYAEYADILRSSRPDCLVLQCTWAEALDLLGPESVDTVVLMDVIEHLERADAERLLDRTIEVARSQVVVETPLGYMEQGSDESKDAWGLDGVDWQVHRSGWEPSDFPGWDIVACDEFHQSDAYGRHLDSPHGAFFAILTKGLGVPAGGPARARHFYATRKADFFALKSRLRRLVY